MAVTFSSSNRAGSPFRYLLAITTLLLLAVAIGASGTTAAAERGPKVGATIPPVLTAPDQNGAERRFEDLTGERGLILLFTRSFDW